MDQSVVRINDFTRSIAAGPDALDDHARRFSADEVSGRTHGRERWVADPGEFQIAKADDGEPLGNGDAATLALEDRAKGHVIVGTGDALDARGLVEGAGEEETTHLDPHRPRMLDDFRLGSRRSRRRQKALRPAARPMVRMETSAEKAEPSAPARGKMRGDGAADGHMVETDSAVDRL